MRPQLEARLREVLARPGIVAITSPLTRGGWGLARDNVSRERSVFTVAAVLTLALGIGGTTAIFTLIHAVMLKSLPVADPASLCRIGDGDNGCVQGSPQDRWGFFSFYIILTL